MQRYCSRASPSVKRIDGTTARNVCRCTHRPFGPLFLERDGSPQRNGPRMDGRRDRGDRLQPPAAVRCPVSLGATRSITTSNDTESLLAPLRPQAMVSVEYRSGLRRRVSARRSDDGAGAPEIAAVERFPAGSHAAPVQRWGAETDNVGPACATSLALAIVHARAAGPRPGPRRPGQPDAEARSRRKGTRSQ
jgi:hypothetical protein